MAARKAKKKAEPRRAPRAPAIDHAHHLRVAHAHAQAAELLRQYPNVKGVGIGFPIKDGLKQAQVGLIVWVDEKRNVNEASTLPKELLGVRVDVQVAPSGRLVAGDASAQGGLVCKGTGRVEFGHIGMLARRPDGKACALTTLHVLVDERLDDDVDAGKHRGTVVEASGDDDFLAIGTIERGGFGTRRDIAQVVLDAGVEVRKVLSGTSTRLGVPLQVTSLDVGAEVRVVVPSEGTIEGTLDAVGVKLPFKIGGNVTREFSGLLQFGLTADFVQKGWCGSMVYAANNDVPLAMITFGADSGPAIAWGFPVAAHWSLWGLGLI